MNDADIGRLYAEQLPRILAFARRMLGDDEAALDAAHDAFLAALRAAGRYRGEGSALSWLLAIVRNECLKRLRGKRRRGFADIEKIIDERREPIPAGLAETDWRRYLAEVKEGCLSGILLRLPAAQRCAFVVHHLAGLSIEETAAALRRSENSTRILLSRARKRLREFLCANCALMGAEGRCSCESMIGFSLKRGLIGKAGGPTVTEAEAELRRFADEAALYASLPDPGPRLAALVESGRYRILAKG